MRVLIVVDYQHDFLPGGALGVPGGDEIRPAIEERMHDDYDLVVASQDWHPRETKHFDGWPVHCVAGTLGADLHPVVEHEVRDGHATRILKGQSLEDDGYSAFEGVDARERPLAELITGDLVVYVDVVGLALDYCVKATALDAQRLGYKVTVPLEATRPVAKDTGDRAIEEMRAAGIEVL
jgi:nicotinamidase/pyrazinamidase